MRRMRNRGLTLSAAPAKGNAMKNLLLLVAACATLMACEKETIDQGAQKREVAAANAAANAANVVLPPSIIATKIYRCADSSVVNVDWLSDKKSANFRAADGGSPVQLKAAAAGEAMTAEGYSLTGDATAAAITLTRPGKKAQSCKA